MKMKLPAKSTVDLTLNEEYKPFSASKIWDLQRDFFQEQGVDAWRQSIVPHYVTSNSFIADSYAKVALAYLRDNLSVIDPNEPVYIIELGAGCGRFAHHFLQHFSTRLKQSLLSHLKFTYVITDIVPRNLKFCRQHPAFQHFIDNNMLDFALFDAETDETLTLLKSRQKLQQKNMKNPLIVIANYVFDGIRQDLFYVNNKKLFEVQAKLDIKASKRRKLSSQDLLEASNLSYRYRFTSKNYYHNTLWNNIIAGYQQNFDKSHILFPTAGLHCLDNLSKLSNKQLLCITADKGAHDLKELSDHDEPYIAKHGSFSLNVNYHALGKYIKQQGGIALQCKNPGDSLDINSFILGKKHNNFIETRQSFNDHIVTFGPNDFFKMKKFLEHTVDYLSLDQLFFRLKISGYDEKILSLMMPRLEKDLVKESLEVRHKWRRIFKEVKKLDYVISK